MKYEFCEKESYLFDLLTLPQYIYLDEAKLFTTEDNFHEMIPEDVRGNMKGFHELLLPFQEKLLPFYYKSQEDHGLIELLTTTESFLTLEEPEEFFEKLLHLEEEELRKKVYYALDYYEKDTEENKKASKEKAEYYLAHPEEVMDWISTLSLGDDAKWHLLHFSRSPRKMVEELISVLRDIEPVFREHYKKFAHAVHTTGEALLKDLYGAEGDGLSKVSNDIIKESLLNWETYPILVSVVNPVALRLNTGNEDPFLAWGMALTSVFNLMAKAEEHRVEERVLFFKNLGDKTRYEVVQNVAHGVYSTKAIAKNLGVTPATVSYHLNNLITAKVLHLEKVGERYIYQVNEAFIRKIFEEVQREFFKEEK